MLCVMKKVVFLQPQIQRGAVAQLVEQRTENPCVTGSTPVSATPKKRIAIAVLFYFVMMGRTPSQSSHSCLCFLESSSPISSKRSSIRSSSHSVISTSSPYFFLIALQSSEKRFVRTVSLSQEVHLLSCFSKSSISSITSK